MSRTLCPEPWNAAFECAADSARCDPAWGIPVSAPGCDQEFAQALACASHGACASEDSFELCHGCCSAYEPEGAVTWQEAFRQCVCRSCPSECGASYCAAESGSPIECSTCADAYCPDEVTTACRMDDGCYRYDVCMTGCPLDASSHCSEEETTDACEGCCVREFAEGAARYESLLGECACGSCSLECLDSDICEGFDLTKPACQRCIDSTCAPVLDETCGSEPACSSYMVCRATCSAD